AGASNLPFFPIRSYYESDIPKVNPKIVPMTSPYEGGDEVYVVPPLRPDVTIVHAQRADESGDAQIWGLLGCQKEAAFAGERVIAASARGLAGARNCFVGVGLPNIVCNLAQRTVARDLQLVYESGVFGARPERLPLSIGDPTLATGATAITSMFELFAYYLQAGLIDVAFLGGAQIDRFGNLNTTVIGSYETPKVRLPGSGGACEIAIHARQIL